MAKTWNKTPFVGITRRVTTILHCKKKYKWNRREIQWKRKSIRANICDFPSISPQLHRGD